MIPLEERDFEHTGIDPKSIIGKPVSEGHYDELIVRSSYVYLPNRAPIVYLNLEDVRFDELVPSLQQLKFPQSNRLTLGKFNKSYLFGAVTAAINRDNFCNVGAIVSKSPYLNRLLIQKYSAIADMYMQKYMRPWQMVGQSLYAKSKIHEDWRMGKSFWTSGIINKNSPHNFHLDSDNIKNAHSAMITLKNNSSGGYLVMPEYRIAFKVSNRSLIFFCGKETIHGVSPINIHEGGYRYSLVYYTTADLKYCQSYENEMQKSIERS